MLKHIKKHTKELREFDENNYNFDNNIFEKEEKENPIEEYFLCQLCNRSLNNNLLSLKQHTLSKKHKINFQKTKIRYYNFVEKAERKMKLRQPGIKRKWNKIEFFKKVYNFC